MRRLAFLAFWLGLTFLIAWFPPVNTAVKGDVPSQWAPTETMYPLVVAPQSTIRVGGAPTPTASALATHRPTATVAPSVLRPAASMSGHSITGVASWYCRPGVSRCTRSHPDGLYAAIRRDLLALRGERVTVCRADLPSVCVVVTIIDCNCGPNANLIDLYSDAFRELAPLSRGVVKVTVHWRTTP